MNRSRNHVVPGLIVLVLSLVASANIAAEDAGMRDRLQACDSCHAIGPESVESPESALYYPPINGKPVEYLYQQLLNFREGRRENPVMSGMLAYLSSDYLHDIAEYYAGLDPLHSSPASLAPMDESREQRARLLVEQGEGEVPACMACHGKDLKGNGVALPGLVGLSPNYLSAQLGAWKAGTRRAREPDCMAKVAQGLSGEDLEAVSQWIARVSMDDQLASVVSENDLPMPCGAVQ